jgi:DNA modification methylase
MVRKMNEEELFSIGTNVYRIINMDSRYYLKLFNDTFDLVIGSPPYADNRDYDAIPPDQYVDWFKEFGDDIFYALRHHGVFVLNIGNKVVKKEKHTYPYEVLLYLIKEVGFHFVEHMIWNKKKMLVNIHSKRPADVYEHLFILTKGLNYKWYPDRVRREYSPKSLKRFNYTLIKRYNRQNKQDLSRRKEWNANPKGAYPKNILDITSEIRKISDIHTSVYPVDLVTWFIKAFTDEGDIILDPWFGTGTTMVSAIRNKRSCIGIEVNREIYLDSIRRVKEEINKND